MSRTWHAAACASRAAIRRLFDGLRAAHCMPVARTMVTAKYARGRHWRGHHAWREPQKVNHASKEDQRAPHQSCLAASAFYVALEAARDRVGQHDFTSSFEPGRLMHRRHIGQNIPIFASRFTVLTPICISKVSAISHSLTLDAMESSGQSGQCRPC